MKKRLALVLACAMLAATAASCSSKPTSTPTSGSTPASTPSSTAAPAITSNTPIDTFVAASFEMNGDFIPGFGNSSYDLSIKTLTGGYCDLVMATPEGGLAMNETYATHKIEEDADGNKTYIFTLKDGIKWNNGDPITAQDYALSILWSASPAFAEVGGSSSLGDGLLGYQAYLKGEADTFAGVKVISDKELALTIDKAMLPYFWETAYLAAFPMYSGTYIPNGKIESSDAGSKITFTEGTLADNCKRISEQERFAPTVTCGPYKFVSFENQTVTLTINENFSGDINGKQPQIKNIVQKAVPATTDVDMVIAGDIDLAPGVIEGKKIEAAKASGTTDLHSYLRAGYGLLAMHCDWGVTADVNIRWALASLVDRAAVLDYVLGGYGGTVDGDFGMAQWMYQEKSAELQDKLKPISFNIDAANDYLDKTDYKFEKDGKTAFDRTKAKADGSYMRYNSKGELLVIEHLGTTENTVTDIIEIQYKANAPLAGLTFNVTKSDFNALMDNYYYGFDLGADRKYNTFNLASNFTPVDDKYWSYHTDLKGTWQNADQLSDEQLDKIMMELRSFDPTDTEAYANKWVEYQARWNELLPRIPLYSNEYFDITHKYVDNMPTTPYANWWDVICDITKTAK